MIPMMVHRRRTRGEGEFPRGVLLAGLLALAVAALGIVFLLDSREEKRDGVTAAAADSLRQQALVAEVFLAPAARVATLSSTPSGPPDGRGRAVYDPSTGRLVVIFDRLRPEPGQRPALWVLAGDEPRYLTSVEPDPSGYAVAQVEVPGHSEGLDALALSLEPDSARGDPAAPAGPVVLLGVLER